MNKLESLKTMTNVVADTGDFAQIKQFQPQDATTNPSLILQAVQIPEYEHILKKCILKHKNASNEDKINLILLDLNVAFGLEILKVVPNFVSTEVDARLSFDEKGTIKYAENIIRAYDENNISKDRILIKIIATWEGIKAAEFLEKKGIKCNLTLIFDQVQAIACAQAKVYLISPFVGRITDWYMAKNKTTVFPSVDNDEGVMSVKNIYKYYKEHGYKTVVMGASFRNCEQIKALSGCDALTISPTLLHKLEAEEGALDNKLQANFIKEDISCIDEIKFRWMLNQNAMATEKLSEGIRSFTSDTVKLEKIIVEQEKRIQS